MNWLETIAVVVGILAALAGAIWWAASIYASIMSTGKEVRRVGQQVSTLITVCDQHRHNCERERTELRVVTEQQGKQIDEHERRLDDHGERIVRLEGSPG